MTKTYLGLAILLFILTACGGGGGSSSTPSEGSNSIDDSGIVSQGSLTLSGTATYTDYELSRSGIDYDSAIQKPIRGAVIELRDATGDILGSTNTSSSGEYSFNVTPNTSVRVMIRAALGPPNAINTEVVDNVNDGATYALFIDIDINNTNITENIHADSGWDTPSRNGTRAAAPFNILDIAYQAQQLVRSIDSTVTFPFLLFNWSTDNVPSTGNREDGDIGQSSYVSNGIFHDIYILGAEDLDTDEYDDAVIAHEWGHYFENVFSRSDSVGGAHGFGDFLHPSVAFSEGFATAFAAIIRNDVLYIDTYGINQSSASIINAEEDSVGDTRRSPSGFNTLYDGYYSEASVVEVVYDIFDSNNDDNDNLSLGFLPIYHAMTSELKLTESFVSIFSFLHYLKIETPSANSEIDSIALAENINAPSANEFEDPTDTARTRLYTPLITDELTKMDTNGNRLQTFNIFGSVDDEYDGNKLLNQRFFKATAATSGCYTVTTTPVGFSSEEDLVLEFSGRGFFDLGGNGDTETYSFNLNAGDTTSFSVSAYSNNVSFDVLFASTPSSCP